MTDFFCQLKLFYDVRMFVRYMYNCAIYYKINEHKKIIDHALDDNQNYRNIIKKITNYCDELKIRVSKLMLEKDYLMNNLNILQNIVINITNHITTLQDEIKHHVMINSQLQQNLDHTIEHNRELERNNEKLIVKNNYLMSGNNNDIIPNIYNKLIDIVPPNERYKYNISNIEAMSDFIAQCSKFKCIVCYDNPRDVLLSCSHLICCSNCAGKLADCPLCRKKIFSITCVFYN